MTDRSSKFGKTWLFNVVFLLVCGGILVFLLKAPPETTPFVPHDDIHTKYFGMEKKEAEKECTPCHALGGEDPMPEEHVRLSDQYNRCLFCHKRK